MLNQDKLQALKNQELAKIAEKAKTLKALQDKADAKIALTKRNNEIEELRAKEKQENAQVIEQAKAIALAPVVNNKLV